MYSKSNVKNSSFVKEGDEFIISTTYKSLGQFAKIMTRGCQKLIGEKLIAINCNQLIDFRLLAITIN